MSDQTIVKIEVNNKFYPISCKIGEEDRVIASGKLLSEIISTLDDNENSETISKGNLDLNEVVLWLEKLNLKFKNIERLINNS